MDGVAYEIGYGKRRVPVYRVHAAPLRGVTPIPESPFTDRANALFACEVDVEVLGNDFLPAYTAGDNRDVVATDSMKNVVLREALAYDGATLEGFLARLGRTFTSTYDQLRTLRLAARELPFAAVPVPDGVGGFAPDNNLFVRTGGDVAVAALEIADDTITGHRSGRVGMELMKLSGSAFTSFVRDGFTTLPDRRDRPLFVGLDIHWRYADVADLLAPDPTRYVPSEQVGDLVRAVFASFVSESIQHLVHEMGTRLLERFPQLAEVSFAARNLTRDPYAESTTTPRAKVYSDPFPAYGEITLTMSRGTA